MLNEAAQSGFIYNARVIGAPPRDVLYQVNEQTHFWNDALVNRVADMKNSLIARAVDGGFDYLFLIDSDLLVEPGLLNHLASLGKDIVSEIFWTAWQPDTMPMPNAWLFDKYDMAHPSLDAASRYAASIEFMDRLREPGVYEVGGLGACTLISIGALKKGVNFSPIKNLSLWGEDRWFCVRAAVLGLPLFIDTRFPATHLYRESDVESIV